MDVSVAARTRGAKHSSTNICAQCTRRTFEMRHVVYETANGTRRQWGLAAGARRVGCGAGIWPNTVFQLVSVVIFLRMPGI